VLKALMTFLPGREITPGSATVFPSNKTLSHRLNGMPESTLRRHLATLVRLGIVSRHDSPNRKRYARVAGQAALVFGFDLAPLAHHWEQLEHAASSARSCRDEQALLRARAGLLRQRLMERDGASSLCEEGRVLLRRKLERAALEGLVARLEEALAVEEMSGSDAQNERHIQTDPNISSEEACTADTSEAPDLQDVLSQCLEYQSYYPKPVRSWHELVSIADRLAGMIGIETTVFQDAAQKMGLKQASIAVLCILERLSQISNPSGYLRRLSQSARAGAFDIKQLLSAALPKGAIFVS
jgi:replication initiation protein RepC